MAVLSKFKIHIMNPWVLFNDCVVTWIDEWADRLTQFILITIQTLGAQLWGTLVKMASKRCRENWRDVKYNLCFVNNIYKALG